MFTYRDTAILWSLVKWSLAITSSNHVEIFAIHEDSRECAWLRSVLLYIRESYGMYHDGTILTVMFGDNTTCIQKLKESYIKNDKTKHVSPRLFIMHNFQVNGEIEIQQIRSSDNLADLFTKSLSLVTYEKLVYKIGMRHLGDHK